MRNGVGKALEVIDRLVQFGRAFSDRFFQFGCVLRKLSLRVAQYFLRFFAFGEIAEYEHRAKEWPAWSANRRGTVINGHLRTVLCDHDRVICESHDATEPQDIL